MVLVNYPEIKEEGKLPVFVRGIGMRYAQEAVARPFTAYPQILYTVRGTGIVVVDGQTYEVPAKTGFFLNKNVEYHYCPKDEKWTVNWVTFDFGMEDMGNRLFLGERFILTTYRSPERMDGIFKEMYNALTMDSVYGGVRAAAEMFRFLVEYNRQLEEIPEVTEKSNRTIHRVVDFINEHYAEDITLELLCESAGGLSEQYLCRLFKQNVGMRPIEYLLKKRIAIARSYLEKTDMPINDIAQLVGFNNASYFYRNFKRFTGTSPLTYRQTALGVKPGGRGMGSETEKLW